MKIGFDSFIVILIMFFPLYFMFRIIKVKNRTHTQEMFFLTMLSLMFWLTGDIFYSIFYGNPWLEFFFMNLRYTGVALLPPTFFITSIAYAKRNFRYRPWQLIIYSVPLLSVVLFWSNDFHNLVFVRNSIISTEIIYGPYFIVHTAYSYFCITIAFAVFLVSSVRSTGILSKQSVLVFIATIIPMPLNIALTFKIITVNINMTLIAIGFSMTLLWVSVFKYDFLNIVPVAIQKVVNSISDAFIVIDRNYKVIEYNRAFSELFIKNNTEEAGAMMFLKDLITISNQEGADFSGLIQCIQESVTKNSVLEFEKYIRSMDKYFNVELSTIASGRNYLGTVVLLKDVTEYKKLFEKLKEQNDELTLLNEQLTDYAGEIKNLTLEKERARVETEIHNLMGHNLNVLLRLMEVCRVTFGSEPDRVLSCIYEAESLIKSTMNSVREIAKEVGRHNDNGDSLENGTTSLPYIEALINNFRKNTGIQVEYSFDGNFSDVDRSLMRTIYNICQEAMTNSLKHGKAEMITVFAKCQSDSLLLSILDDGTGCSNINKTGMGLAGMQEMVKSHNGNIDFKSDESDGFKISVTIPLK